MKQSDWLVFIPEFFCECVIEKMCVGVIPFQVLLKKWGLILNVMSTLFEVKQWGASLPLERNLNGIMRKRRGE